MRAKRGEYQASKKRQPDFTQIDRWQGGKPDSTDQFLADFIAGWQKNPRQFENLFADEDTHAKRWIRAWLEKLSTARRYTEIGATTTDRTRNIEEAYLPYSLIFDLNFTLGLQGDRKLESTSDWPEPAQAYDIKDIAEKFQCSEEQALELIGFVVILDLENNIETFFQKEERGWKSEDWEKTYPPQTAALIKKMFRDKDRFRKIVEHLFIQAAPLIARLAQPESVDRIIHHLKIRGIPGREEMIMQNLRNAELQAKYKNQFSELPLGRALALLPNYEMIFGRLATEEFLALFPNWHTVPQGRSKLARKYGLEIPKPTPTPVSRSMDQLTAQPETGRKERDRPTIGMEAGLLFLGFAIGAIAYGVKKLDDYTGSVRRHPEAGAATELTDIPSLDQKETAHVSNFSFESHEAQPDNPDFRSSPTFGGMRATQVFTTLTAEPGVLKLEPSRAFYPQMDSFDDSTGYRYTIAERFHSQGGVLYPPDLGIIDTDSIYLNGYTRDDYEITVDPSGRVLIALNEPSFRPIEAVYQILDDRDDEIEFQGMVYKPKPVPPELLKLNPVLESKIKPGESQEDFAHRIEQEIKNEWQYPDKEHLADFAEDLQKGIGDCDVANYALLVVLHNNGIPAELVGDMHPVPGRERHGLLRAIVRTSEHKSKMVILDATPSSFNISQEIVDKPELSLEEKKQRQRLGDLIDHYEQERPQRTGSLNVRETSEQELAIEDTEAGEMVEPPDDEPGYRSDDMYYREKNALRRGLWGLCEYELLVNGQLPADPQAREKKIRAMTWELVDVLKMKRIIPRGIDPEKWSLDIDDEVAEKVIEALEENFTFD